MKAKFTSTLLEPTMTIILLLHCIFLIAQDKIIFQSDNYMNVKIEKVTSNEIYYIKPGSDRSYAVEKKYLKQINYANGDSVVFNSLPEKTDTIIPEKIRKGVFKFWVYYSFNSHHGVRRGYLHAVNDQGIVLTVDSLENFFYITDAVNLKINAVDIDKLKIRRRDNVGIGILIGAGVGFFTGAFLGLAGIPDYGIFESLPPEENALTGGILFSIPGMLIGGLVGSARLIIPINKSLNTFEKRRKEIRSYISDKY
jgi:hypothetical protein